MSIYLLSWLSCTFCAKLQISQMGFTRKIGKLVQGIMDLYIINQMCLVMDIIYHIFRCGDLLKITSKSLGVKSAQGKCNLG